MLGGDSLIRRPICTCNDMMWCVEAAALTCPSSNTYMVLIKPECASLVEAAIRARGHVVYEAGGVVGARVGEASITFIRPTRLLVKLPLEKGLSEFLAELLGPGLEEK